MTTNINIVLTSNRDVSVTIDALQYLSPRTLEIVGNAIEKEYLRLRGDAVRESKREAHEAAVKAEAAQVEADRLSQLEAEETAKFRDAIRDAASSIMRPLSAQRMYFRNLSSRWIPMRSASRLI